ncbi:nuclease [Phenylobacterium sp.]|uniref:nuclease n=1 Tax=Phenylobacterium sp. TaxID=1871053 RepID=UPI0025DE1B6B|nr:nuclease [Phenylobacterium sp.]
MISNGLILGLALTLLGAGAAAAESDCGGAPLAAGTEVHGPVLHVIDGQTLCVARGSDPSQWVAVRLEDAPASASWGALMSVAFAKDVTCAAQSVSGAGVCRIEGRSVGAQLDPAAVRAGVAWRQPTERVPHLAAPTRVAAAY